MFPSEEKSAPAARKLRPPSKKVMFVGGGLLAFGLVLIAFLVFIVFGTPAVKVPANITQKVKSSIYLPGKLPGNYEIVKDSFSMVENDSVLVFNAEDGAGGSLVFSEQPKPKNFNFDDFYKTQFTDAKTLSGVLYPSVTGTAMDGRHALSIVADDTTWILIATSSPLGDDDLRTIAANIRKL